MKLLKFLPLYCAILTTSAWASTMEQDAMQTCLSSREYVTTLEYLRDQDAYKLKEIDRQKLADKISQGCTGSAKRFIKINTLLIKAGFGTTTSIKTATDFALSTDQEADSFVAIFKTSFLKDFLDLNLAQSLKVAQTLSLGFTGDQEIALKDFKTISKFCLNSKTVDLPLDRCIDIAAKIVVSGQIFSQPLGKVYTKLFDFLISE